MRTDDPIADFLRWDEEQNQQLERLPVCADCGERIQDEHLYLINDEVICHDCLVRYYRKSTDDYTE